MQQLGYNSGITKVAARRVAPDNNYWGPCWQRKGGFTWFHLFFGGIIGEIGELPVSCLVAQILVLIRLDRALNIPESTVADRHLVYAGIAHV